MTFVASPLRQAVLFDVETGRISSMLEAVSTDDFEANKSEKTDFLEVQGAESVTAQTHWVPPGSRELAPRPVLCAVSSPSMVSLDEVPSGARVEVVADLHHGVYDLVSQAVSVCLPDRGRMVFSAPWPWVPCEVSFDLSPSETGLVLPVDLEAARVYYLAQINTASDEAVHALLGHPDRAALDRWAAAANLYRTYRAGQMTDADRKALTRRLAYSGLTEAEEINRIGERCVREAEIRACAEALREAGRAQIQAATSAPEILAALEWARTEKVNLSAQFASNSEEKS